MKPRRKLACTLVLACLPGMSACASDPPETDVSSVAGSGFDKPPAACTPEQLEFVTGPSGMLTMGATMRAQARTLVANPLQPKKYYNDWTIGFLDAAGQSLNDVDIVSVCAFMPEHDHYEPPQAITRLTDPSTFELKALNLSMRGAWQVQVAINSPTLGGAPSMATKCDERRPDRRGSEMIVLHACIEDP